MGCGVRREAYLIIQASILFIWYPDKLILLVNKKIVCDTCHLVARKVTAFFFVDCL